MDRILSPRGWQILGVIIILFGVFSAFYSNLFQSVILFGGGSAMILLLGRAKPNQDNHPENGQ